MNNTANTQTRIEIAAISQVKNSATIVVLFPVGNISTDDRRAHTKCTYKATKQDNLWTLTFRGTFVSDDENLSTLISSLRNGEIN